MNSSDSIGAKRQRKPRDPVKNRATVKAWSQENVERKRANNARWRQENAERMRAARARWKAKNKAKLAAYKHTRRARKNGSGGKLSDGIVAKLMALQLGRCANCRCVLVKFELDHITALSRGGFNVDENVQLLCPPCNHRKGAKDPIEFAQQEGRLL